MSTSERRAGHKAFNPQGQVLRVYVVNSYVNRLVHRNIVVDHEHHVFGVRRSEGLTKQNHLERKHPNLRQNGVETPLLMMTVQVTHRIEAEAVAVAVAVAKRHGAHPNGVDRSFEHVTRHTQVVHPVAIRTCRFGVDHMRVKKHVVELIHVQQKRRLDEQVESVLSADPDQRRVVRVDHVRLVRHAIVHDSVSDGVHALVCRARHR
eukprot:693256-Prorocentrum_minimum.AAC.22